MTAKNAAKLLAKWEAFAKSLADGYEFDLDEWLNDVDVRQLLADAVDDDPKLQARLAAADANVRAATTPHAKCLWGTTNETQHGWSAGEQWWYFVVPKRSSDAFRAGLRRVK